MIGVSLVGADGSAWDLRGGPVVLGPGPEGFGLPSYDRPTVETPTLDGQRLLAIGSRAKARSGILPCILTPQDTEAAWLTMQRAWWAAWSPDVPATLTVTDPQGATRSIAAFLDSDDGYGLELDPAVNLFEQVPVSWIADDPWWRGPERSVLAGGNTGTDYLNGGNAPPLTLQSGALSTTGTLQNPGEVPAWPVYRISAGTTSWSVTVSGQTTAGSFAVPGGSRLEVNTDPAAQTALLIDLTSGNVTNVTPQLTAIGFARVPVGTAVPVTVRVAGSDGASIAVAISPRYRRAF